jgi:hypothetical protein
MGNNPSVRVLADLSHHNHKHVNNDNINNHNHDNNAACDDHNRRANDDHHKHRTASTGHQSPNNINNNDLSTVNHHPGDYDNMGFDYDDCIDPACDCHDDEPACDNTSCNDND